MWEKFCPPSGLEFILSLDLVVFAALELSDHCLNFIFFRFSFTLDSVLLFSLSFLYFVFFISMTVLPALLMVFSLFGLCSDE